MPIQPKPYDLGGDWTPEQAARIDEMFEILFREINAGTISAQFSEVVPVDEGGTGLDVYAIGDMLYASAATVLARLAAAAAGNALLSGATPSWGKVTLTGHVSGVLPEANGGTNQSTWTQGDLLYASAANTLAKLAKSAAASRYLSNTGAANAPAWAQVNLADGVTGVLPVANGGTGSAVSLAKESHVPLIALLAEVAF